MAAEIRVDRITSRTGINTLSFTESGISYNFNVGFGTTSPRSRVDVEGDIRVSGVVTATSFKGDGSTLTGVAATSNISTNAIVNSGITTVAAGSTSAPSITPVGDNNTGIFFPAADTVAIGEGGAEALRIDSSGRVGLSSTSPKVSLDLSQKTDAIALPQGTTAQRPSGNSPYIRYNTTNSALEFYNGTEFVEIISDYFPSGSTILG